MRLNRDYYELCVDHTDPPVFWPLTIHEIAHCWLSKHEYVDDILSQHSSNIRDISLDTAASRIEESLCDVIATKLIGPAYPLAFINRLWAQLGLEIPDYPKNNFRIECMAKVLDLQDFNDESISLRNLSDAEFEYPYHDEEISCTLDDLCSVSQVLPSLSSEIVKKESQHPLSKIKLEKSEDLSSIFYASWLKIIRVDGAEADSTINSVSDILLDSLIGASESCHSSA